MSILYKVKYTYLETPSGTLHRDGETEVEYERVVSSYNDYHAIAGIIMEKKDLYSVNVLKCDALRTIKE